MVALPSNSFFSLLSPPLFSIPFLLIKSGAITLQCPYIFSDLASGRITELIFGVILVCLLHWYQFSGTKFHGIIDTCWLLHFKVWDICFAYDVDYSLFAGFFSNKISFFFFFYNIVLALPYINMHLPRVYTCSPSWTPLPPPSPSHPSGTSQCTSPEHPVSCIESGLAICFLYDIIHVSCHSPKSSYPLPLAQCPKDCSIHMCLFCCLAYRVIVTIFLNSIYMC